MNFKIDFFEISYLFLIVSNNYIVVFHRVLKTTKNMKMLLPQCVKNTRVKNMSSKDMDLYSAGTDIHVLQGTVYILHIPIKVDVWTCRFLKDNHIHFPISYSSILLDYDRH